MAIHPASQYAIDGALPLPQVLVALILLGLGPALAHASNDRLEVKLAGHIVTLTSGNQALTISLNDASLTLRSPNGSHIFRGSFQQGDGWARPSPATSKPEIKEGADSASVRIRYPLPGKRELILEASTVKRISAFFVTSRLRRLVGVGAEYYFWDSDVAFGSYFRPGVIGPEEKAIALDAWESIECEDWLFFPMQRGGLAVLPTNTCGRSPGKEGCLYLHVLPRSDVIAPGEELCASFGLAAVGSARATAALAAAAKTAHIPALEPWVGIRRLRNRDYGRPAPVWLRNVEMYNLYYHPAAQWTDEVVSSTLRGFPFIIGSTPDLSALRKCHQAGVRLLHYVVYTCLLDTKMQTEQGGKVYSEWSESIDNASRDLKDHPDWVCIDEQGKVRKDAWGQAHGHPGLLNTCLHQPGLQEAALRQVKLLMEMGYDGVFVDLAGPAAECYGPKFGRHTHPDAAKSNTEAYEDLLRMMYRLVKSYGDDRIVVHNTCVAVEDWHWPYADAQMREAFPFGNETGNLLPTWQEMKWVGARQAEAAKQGKVTVLLSYLNKVPLERLRAAALFSYAYARLYGFLWADGLAILDRHDADQFAKDLYSTRLGRPTRPMRSEGDLLYRAFTNGIVVLNPTKRRARLTIPVARAASLTDVGYDRKLVPVRSRLRVECEPESGRVLVWSGAS